MEAGFRKGRGTRDYIASIHWVVEKINNSRKTSIFASLTMLKPLTVWITTNGRKFLKMEYQTPWNGMPASCMQFKKKHLELDVEQWTDTKFKKEYAKAVYCHSAF